MKLRGGISVHAHTVVAYDMNLILWVMTNGEAASRRIEGLHCWFVRSWTTCRIHWLRPWHTPIQKSPPSAVLTAAIPFATHISMTGCSGVCPVRLLQMWLCFDRAN